MLRQVSWYTERPLTEISLGGLLILVVIRTIQYNMTKMRVRRTVFNVTLVARKLIMTNQMLLAIELRTVLPFCCPIKRSAYYFRDALLVLLLVVCVFVITISLQSSFCVTI